MRARQLLERAADFVTQQDPCLTWLDWELARWLGSSFFGWVQESCR